jgi:hypothetical protein
MIKHKYFILTTVLLFLFIFSASFTLALEIKYPPLPMVGSPNDCVDNCLPVYVSYWFTFGIYVAGILAVLSFTFGAIQIIMAASSPDMEKEGKDRMKGAILGLILTLSSFVIMRTINLSIANPTLTALPGVAGVFYYNGTNRNPVGLEEPNTANRPAGYDKIIYDCSDASVAPKLFIWEFPKTNFQGSNANYSDVKVVEKTCGQEEPIDSYGSFKMAFETPGVYYFLGEGCDGYMSNANLSSQDQIAPPFAGNIKSVKIINGNGKYYGIIFHQTMGFKNAGDCSNSIKAPNGGCFNLSTYSFPNFLAYSDDIFSWNKDNPTTISSGDGVTFYSDNNGWNANKQAGKIHYGSNDIKGYFDAEAQKILFNWNGVATSEALNCSQHPFPCSAQITCTNDPNCPNGTYCNEGLCGSGKACEGNKPCPNGEFCYDGSCGATKECCACATAQDFGKQGVCSGSVEINGNYLVNFYTPYKDDKNNTHLYCQTFTQDLANLSQQQFLPSENPKLYHVEIIPTK